MDPKSDKPSQGTHVKNKISSLTLKSEQNGGGSVDHNDKIGQSGVGKASGSDQNESKKEKKKSFKHVRTYSFEEFITKLH